ncbi:MAG: single-stranded DNA-binding protein [Thermoplasmata archaeon]
MEQELTKVKDLTPGSKQVNVLAKVVSVSEPKEIPSRYGGEGRKVAEAIIGDETGTIVLSLWQEQIGTVAPGDVVLIGNGYISLVRGHMHLNVGKYGSLTKSTESVDEVNTSVDMSAQEYEQPRREFRGRRNFNKGRDRDNSRRRF